MTLSTALSFFSYQYCSLNCLLHRAVASLLYFLLSLPQALKLPLFFVFETEAFPCYLLLFFTWSSPKGAPLLIGTFGYLLLSETPSLFSFFSIQRLRPSCAASCVSLFLLFFELPSLTQQMLFLFAPFPANFLPSSLLLLHLPFFN